MTVTVSTNTGLTYTSNYILCTFNEPLTQSHKFGYACFCQGPDTFSIVHNYHKLSIYTTENTKKYKLNIYKSQITKIKI